MKTPKANSDVFSGEEYSLAGGENSPETKGLFFANLAAGENNLAAGENFSQKSRRGEI